MYGLNPSDDAMKESLGQTDVYTQQPGAFDNLGGALMQQWGKGGANLENVAGNIADPFVQSHATQINDFFGPAAVSNYQSYRSAEQDVIANTQVDPNTTGWLGRNIAPMMAMAPALAAAAATGPLAPVTGAGLLGTQAFNESKLELKQQGVDDTAATEASIPTALTNAVLGFLPFGVGGNILARTAVGAAMQGVTGVTDRYFTSHILRANGYDEMANQYDPLDKQALFSDLIMGGLFGAMHTHAKTMDDKIDNIDGNPPSVNDAAMAANSVNQLEADSAPGVPTTVNARNAHVDTMKDGTESVIMGDSPDVTDVVNNPDFVAKPVDDTFDQMLHDSFRQTMEEAAQKAGYGSLEEANEARNEKYIDVLDKHEQANKELDDLNSQLQDLEGKMQQTTPPTERLGGQDQVVADRIEAINRQLEAGGSKTATKKLTAERDRLTAEHNALFESVGLDEAQQSYEQNHDEQRQQHDELTKKIDQKERQVDRYAGEIDKRGQQLGLGRMERPEGAPEKPMTLENPEETATKDGEATKSEKPHEMSTGEEEGAAGAEEAPESKNDLNTDEGITKEVEPETEPDSYQTRDQAAAEKILQEKTPEFLVDSRGNQVSAEEAINQVNDLQQKAEQESQVLDAAAVCGARNGLE